MKKGQTLLIVMLVLTIAVTVALSLIGRATTDVAMTTQIEESARAFNAAEAGIEEALLKGTGTNGQIVTLASDTNTKYKTDIVTVGGTESVYRMPNRIEAGDVATVFLVAHDDNDNLIEDSADGGRYTGGTIDVCWEHGTVTPAVEVAVVYAVSGAYYVTRNAYDPDSSRIATTDTGSNFSSVTGSSTNGCGVENYYGQTITLPSGAGVVPLFLRIRPYFSPSTFAVLPSSSALPEQGTEIVSEGSTGNTVVRKIVVRKSYGTAPSALDYVTFSQGAFTH